MGIIDALILGIVQGLTEFLPVSSSGHIELGKVLLNSDLDAADGLLFTIIVHTATALSTMIVFRKDIAFIIRDLLTFRWTDSTNLVVFILISMVPAVVVALLFEDALAALFDGNILLVGCMLLFTGLMLFLTTFITRNNGILNYWKSFVIGCGQAIALLPGISRSGTTIAIGLMLNIRRKQMARFSFLMVLPLIFGAMIKDLMDYNPSTSSQVGILPLIFGFLAAFIAGLFACRWMIILVRKSKLIYFAIYCFIIGAVAIILSF